MEIPKLSFLASPKGRQTVSEPRVLEVRLYTKEHILPKLVLVGRRPPNVPDLKMPT